MLDEANTPIWVDCEPVTISGGMLQPLSSSERQVFGTGQEVNNLYKFITGNPWPGGVHSVIESGGKLFDQVGSALHHCSSPGTEHWVVTLRERTPEVM